MLQISPEIKNSALPLVALESAVTTHGLPRPLNEENALAMEEALRKGGVLPATTALWEGHLRVGMKEGELIGLARTKETVKVGLHNLLTAVHQGATGGTTVASTAWLAQKSQISCMATGGIGGVHRENSRDISGDLPALAQTEVIVVSSGVKSILDLRATREWLETWHIPTVGYRCEEFPGFYTAQTGLTVDYCASSPAEIASLWQKKKDLGRPGALLVFQPPPPKSALDSREVEELVQEAQKLAGQKKIKGQDLTPFLLKTMKDLSQGRTLQVNLDLLEANASLAGKIAAQLA